MDVTERRVVVQEWYETDCSKTGWDSHGWIFKDDRTDMDNSWTVVEHLDTDKHSNPTIAIAEKTTDIWTI
jgi:hypothetical protein